MFVFAGRCPKVIRRARWPPTRRTSTAKRYSHRCFDHLVDDIPSETAGITASGSQYALAAGSGKMTHADLDNLDNLDNLDLAPPLFSVSRVLAKASGPGRS